MTALDNPYFDAVAGGVTVGTSRDDVNDHAVEVRRRREELVQEYAWAIPNTKAIDTLVGHDPLLEVGAGNGYWASLVEQAGGDIVVTDPLDEIPSEPDTWAEVWVLGYRQAIERFGEGRTLFICWPNQDRWAFHAVRQFIRSGGTKLIYVGEGRGGVTANQAFHEELFHEFELEETVDIPTYLGCRDRLEVWVR